MGVCVSTGATVTMVDTEKLRQKARTAAMRRAVRVVAKRAKEIVPVKTGKLKRSISYGVRKKGKLGLVKARVKTAPHAHLVEYGTRPHVIRAKSGHVLNIGPLHIIAKSVHHPGAKPNPFLELAAAQSKGRIEQELKSVPNEL